MNILAIETSCDDTAISIIKADGGLENPEFEIKKNLISSQIKVHQPYGGVVPALAKREHEKNLPNLLKEIGDTKDIDLIAITVGPGLSPALWAGVNFAQELAKEISKPIQGVNHLEGHLYSSLIDPKNKLSFPAVGLLVSGGHTILVLMKSLTEWEKLGETKDDAVGEAFDKVARMLDLPYPGGPEIEKLAEKGEVNIDFPRAMLKKDYDFSFSGLKTAVLYYLKENPKAKKGDVAASFQEAAVDVLVKKTKRAVDEYVANSVFIGGGVAANKHLKESLRKNIDLDIIVPGLILNTDNAAMIGAAAYINKLSNKSYELKAQPNLNL